VLRVGRVAEVGRESWVICGRTSCDDEEEANHSSTRGSIDLEGSRGMTPGEEDENEL